MNIIYRFLFIFRLEMLKDRFKGREESDREWLIERWKLLAKYSMLLANFDNRRPRLRKVSFKSELNHVDEVLSGLRLCAREIKKGTGFRPEELDKQFHGLSTTNLYDYLVSNQGYLIQPSEVPKVALSDLTYYTRELQNDDNQEHYERINGRLFEELSRYTSAMEDLARKRQ